METRLIGLTKLKGCEFSAVVIDQRVDGEFVVRAAVSEVDTSRDGEVGFECDGEKT